MITIYSENKSPRLQFTLEVLFKRCLGLEYKLISNWEKFKEIDLPRINYSERKHKNSLRIVPSGLLFESDIREQKIKVKKWENLFCFFQTDKNGDCPFDLFAAAFYQVSRYEEYLPYTSDEHGRFPYTESLAYKEGFIQNPVVNQYAMKLAEILAEKQPNYAYNQNAFKFISTIDVDMAYCYNHKGFWRNLGGFSRDLLQFHFKKLLTRYRVLRGLEKDPYDNFDYQEKFHSEVGAEVIYFVLLANHGKYDKSIDFENESFIQLIQDLSEKREVGIHPSYHSHKIKKRVKEEIIRLRNITLKEVKSSRQHFLKLDIRVTYKLLNHFEIENDHSMGYSEITGFRAGICSPYPFFDLQKNESTKLLLYPFAVMDVALNRFMKLDPNSAVSHVNSLMDRVKQVHGTFISVFHNESLSDFDDWKGWRKTYETIVRRGTAL
ncbi:MAG: polysaccharide deacetylase family protein [Bacteroidia bacterium]